MSTEKSSSSIVQIVLDQVRDNIQQEKFANAIGACEVGLRLTTKLGKPTQGAELEDYMALARKHVCDPTTRKSKEFPIIAIQTAAALADGATKFSLQTAYTLPSIFPGLFKHRTKQLQKALLLYSPPGFGKTYSVQSMVKYIQDSISKKCNLRIITAADLRDSYVGVTEQNIKSLYDTAAKEASGGKVVSVLFFDEVETLLLSRTATGVNQNNDNTMAMFLQMLDGAIARPGILTILATNLPWLLDSAILSRCQSKILVDLPNNQARKLRIEAHLKDSIEDYDENNDKKKLDRFVRYLVAKTGMEQTAIPKMRRNGIPEDFFVEKGFFPSEGHTFSKEKTFNEFGYSYRDLNNMLNALIDQVASDKVDCSVKKWPEIDRHEVSFRKTTECNNVKKILNHKCVQSPKKVKLFVADLLRWGGDESYVKSVRPNASLADDYIRCLLYSLNSAIPPTMIKND